MAKIEYFEWVKGESFPLSKNFSSHEFECRCRREDCVTQKISKDLIKNLQKLREVYGKSLTITSGYRCIWHNRAIGSSDTSQHPLGNAADVACSDLATVEKQATDIFDAIGNGKPKGFIHLDIRTDKKRYWLY